MPPINRMPKTNLMKRRRNSFQVKSYFAEQISSRNVVQKLVFITSWLFAVYCFLFQHVYVILILTSFATKHSIIWQMVPRLISCLTSAVAFDLWIYKRRTILKFNSKMERHLKTIMNDYQIDRNLPEARLCLLGGSLYIIFSVIIVALATVFSPYNNELDIWVENLCIVCNATNIDRSTHSMVALIDIVSYTLGTVGSGVIIQVMFVFVCLSLGALTGIAYKNLRFRFKSRLGQSRGEMIEEPLKRDEIIRYRKLCKYGKSMLKQINHVYSTVFLLWYGSSLLCTCLAVTEMLSKYPTLKAIDYGVYLVIYGQSLVGVLVISIVSSDIPQKVSKNVKYFQELTMSYKHIQADVYGEINILISQINYPPCGVMVGDCFLITKSFFLSYLGVILTYAVLLIQLDPNLVQKLRLNYDNGT